MTFIRGLLAVFSVWLIFLGIIESYNLHLNGFPPLVGGGLLLAIAYDALEKPLFFLVPVSGIGCAFAFSPDSKGLCACLGMLLGILVSSRWITYYYQNKSRDN
jgi:hypothetical protein